MKQKHPILFTLITSAITRPLVLWGAALFVFGCAIVFFLYTPQTVPEQRVMVQAPTVTLEPATDTSQLPDIDERATVLFVSDVMLGRYVETLMQKYGDDYPFEKIEPLLSSTSAVVGNLEGPISADHYQTANGSLVFNFDRSVAQVLARHHLSAVSLANNHTYDQGPTAYDFSRQTLTAAGVTPFGHPRIIDPEQSMTELTVGNQTVRLYGYTNAVWPRFDADAAVQLVASTADDATDVVFIHWGTEYQLHSNAAQQELAHRFIDAGADVVIGHHPHVTQEVERYNGKIIFYSLGNFIFDQYFSTDTQQALAIVADLSTGAPRYQLVPIISSVSQPAVMDDVATQAFLQGLADRSDPALHDAIMSGVMGPGSI